MGQLSLWNCPPHLPSGTTPHAVPLELPLMEQLPRCRPQSAAAQKREQVSSVALAAPISYAPSTRCCTVRTATHPLQDAAAQCCCCYAEQGDGCSVNRQQQGNAAATGLAKFLWKRKILPNCEASHSRLVWENGCTLFIIVWSTDV